MSRSYKKVRTTGSAKPYSVLQFKLTKTTQELMDIRREYERVEKLVDDLSRRIRS